MHSFIEIDPDSHFSLQNLPFGIFSPPNAGRRVGVAIGEWVLDLSVLARRGLFADARLPDVLAQPTLNGLMALGRPAWREVRTTVQSLLRADNPTLRDDRPLRDQVFCRQSEVQTHLPAAIGDYTDFYSSKAHASNVGQMFRGPENPLLPNWKHLPVAYHGRASSVILSDVDVRRPQGQMMPPGAESPIFGPSRELDFELEAGFFVGPGNEVGRPVPVTEAEAHIFGLVLVNDWSARDIQRWEYRPLGPFLAKNFATSISPWVVTLEALAPFRCPGPAQKPPPLPYLAGESWSFDIHLEVALQTPGMSAPQVICRSNFRHLYWSMSQQLAHHTVTGCNLRPGDLLASGTISGPGEGMYGSLLEMTWGGERPLSLPNGETRTFLQDGDRVTLSGYCQGDGYRVGLGAVTAQILPASS